MLLQYLRYLDKCGEPNDVRVKVAEDSDIASLSLIMDEQNNGLFVIILYTHGVTVNLVSSHFEVRE